jgi:16S rRNA processing protein RimM
MLKKKILMGHVARTHGIRGEVVLHLFNKKDSVFKKGVSIDLGGVLYKLERITFGNNVIAKFAGIELIEDADKILKKEIFLERDLFPKVKESEFYLCDLLQMKVLDQNDQEVGEVRSYYENGPQIVLEISGAKNFEIPFVNDFILQVTATHLKVRVPEYIE